MAIDTVLKERHRPLARVSRSTRIRQLEAQNAKLLQTINKLNAQVSIEHTARKVAEAKLEARGG